MCPVFLYPVNRFGMTPSQTVKHDIAFGFTGPHSSSLTLYDVHSVSGLLPLLEVADAKRSVLGIAVHNNHSIIQVQTRRNRVQ